jgi:hypothetical protein
MTSTDLRYPIGRFERETNLTNTRRAQLIDGIAALPTQLRSAVHGLTEEQLSTPYRPEGWTVRQVVHHVADSHLNAYIRFKLALTEPEPTIKPYDEKVWAALADSRTAPPEISLALLESLHNRWSFLLRSLNSQEFTRKFHHPESGTLTLETQLDLYHWHGLHHLAHITSLKRRMGWA